MGGNRSWRVFEGVHLNCDLCASTESELLLEKGGASYRRCQTCGFIFSDLAESASIDANDDYFSAEVERYVAKCYDPAKQAAYRRILAAYRSYRQNGRLLEVGANVGGFLYCARNLGWEVTGVEPVAACAARARAEGLEIREAFLEDADLPANHFDGVFSNAVFEHLRHPSRVFAEVFRVLRPGGLVIIDTVNWESYTRERIGEDWKLIDPVVHLCLYSPQTLRAHAEKAGLDVIAIKTRGYRRLPNHQPRPRGWARIADELQKLPYSALSRWTKKGDSIALWARKPFET